VRQVGYLPELYKDASSEKYKIFSECFTEHCITNLIILCAVETSVKVELHS
jgi:hypothetical protein